MADLGSTYQADRAELERPRGPDDLAILTFDGQTWRDWETVYFRREFGKWPSIGVFTLAEPGEIGHGYEKMRIRPPVKSTLSLAGQQVMDGFVEIRQAAYDAHSHAVQIQVASRLIDPVKGSVMNAKDGFKGYTLEEIAKSVMKPFNITVKTNNMPEGANDKFDQVYVFPGETAQEFLERIARPRGVHFVDDEKGNLIMGRSDGKGNGITLKEGGNIKAARGIINCSELRSQIHVEGQGPGSDNRWGMDANRVGAVADIDMMKDRHRPMRLIAEEPGKGKDMKKRAEREAYEQVGQMYDVQIIVQGWLKTGGKELWRVGEHYYVDSPMLTITQELACKAVTYEQNNRGGTYTTIDMVLPQHLGIPLSEMPRSDGQGGDTGQNPGRPGAEQARELDPHSEDDGSKGGGSHGTQGAGH